MLNNTFSRTYFLSKKKKRVTKRLKRHFCRQNNVRKAFRLTNVTKAVNIYVHTFDLKNIIKVILSQKGRCNLAILLESNHIFVTDIIIILFFIKTR